MKIRSFGNTDIGRRRSQNEDAFWNAPEHHLFAVADGLGGLAAGEQASQLAISILKSHQKIASKNKSVIDFEKVFAEANHAIRKLGEQIDQERGAGTTLTVARLAEGEVWLTFIGDSPAFLFTDDGWRKLSIDHTAAEDFRNKHPNKPVPPAFEHLLTRCLGQPRDATPGFSHTSVNPGDCLFLCSDGVTLEILPEEIRNWAFEEKDPEKLVQKVLTLARRRGGADNATAIAVYIDE